MPFPYKKVLVIGATSGIGAALASKLVEEGSYVIAVGRRKENLEDFVHQHGKDKSSAVPFDITELEKIPNFATNITKTHTDLDCILLNSGVQNGLDFLKPDTIDLSILQTEFNTNYMSQLALTKAFLPFLQNKKGESALIYTTSSLALVPMMRCANYCATKAALHHVILVLREQLKDTSIKVVELYPPAVQTELHDEKHQPDLQNGHQIGMPLDQFIAEAYEGLAGGNEEVLVGDAKDWFNAFELQRQKIFHGRIKAM
ncbi:hypothetical protein MMC12_002563 [Toensbergia leucococca]|nr:hypothetical protein [Toensbergia leucococca]